MKKPILYLHMGVTKTGSTALQSFLAANMPLLEENGIIYPIPDDNPINRRFWVGNSFTFALSFLDKTYDVQVVGEIASKMAKQAHQLNKNVLLSCEVFSYLSEPKDVRFFCESMTTHFNLVIIAYIRDPLDWYFSRWKQEIRIEPETRPFKEFVEKFPIQWTHTPIWLSYADGVHVLSFDEHKKDLLSPFLSVLGVKPPAEKSLEPGSLLSIDNRSLTDSELAFFLTFNQNQTLLDKYDLRLKINGAFMFSGKSQAELSYSYPDPTLAALAEDRHEQLFQIIEPYLSREKVVRAHEASRKVFGDDHLIDRRDMVIALEVINNFFNTKEK